MPGTHRGSPFNRGEFYRVIAEGVWWYQAPTVGDILRYEGAKWSHYDGASAYIFSASEANNYWFDGNKYWFDGYKYWWFLRDDELLKEWQRVFSKCDPTDVANWIDSEPSKSK